MEKTKNSFYILLSILIILVGGSIVAFLIAKEYNGFFWISYISFIISILYLTYSSLYFVKSNDGEEPVKVSLITCSILYIIATGILIILGSALSINIKLYLVFHLICFAIFLILLISIIGSHDIIKNQNSTVTNNKLYINTLCIEISKLLNNVSSMPNEISTEITPLLNSLQDKVRYMDPMTNESVTSYDIKIKDGIKDIENILVSYEANVDLIPKIQEQVKQLIDTISIRNDILKASK